MIEGDIFIFEKKKHKPDLFVGYVIKDIDNFLRFQIMYSPNRLYEGRTYQFKNDNKSIKYMRVI